MITEVQALFTKYREKLQQFKNAKDNDKTPVQSTNHK